MATHVYPATRKSPTRQVPLAITTALTVAAASGDRRATLAALRDLLATVIGEAAPRDMAALAGRLMAVLADLDRLPIVVGNPVDELAERVARKRAAATQTGV